MAEARRPGRPRKQYDCVNDDGSSSGSPGSAPSLVTSTENTQPSSGTSPSYPLVDGNSGGDSQLNMSPIIGPGGNIMGLLRLESVNFESPSFPGMPAAAESEVPKGSSAEHSLNKNQCLRELSQLNVDLHYISSRINAEGPSLTFESYICSQSGDGLTVNGMVIFETALHISQRFHKAIANLEWLQRHEIAFDYSVSVFNDITSLDYAMDESSSMHLETLLPGFALQEEASGQPPTTDKPLLLVIISCYVQLINLFTDIFGQIYRKLKSFGDSGARLPALEHGVALGSYFVVDGRLQGMMFCSIVVHTFDRIECILGLLPSDTVCQRSPIVRGLLSRPHHRHLLEKELESDGIQGKMKPQLLRDSIENVRQLLASDPSW